MMGRWASQSNRACIFAPSLSPPVTRNKRDVSRTERAILAHIQAPPRQPSSNMAALTTSSVTAVSAVRGARATFGSRAAFAAPARPAVASRASLKVQAANRELWCVGLT